MDVLNRCSSLDHPEAAKPLGHGPSARTPTCAITSTGKKLKRTLGMRYSTTSRLTNLSRGKVGSAVSTRSPSPISTCQSEQSPGESPVLF